MTVSGYGGIAKWIAVAAVVVIGAGVAGWWLANLTAPSYETTAAPAPRAPVAEPATRAPVAAAYTPPEPPLYLYVNTLPGADTALTGEEIRMAAQAGIHNYIITAPLPWGGEDEPGYIIDRVDWVLQLDPEAQILVELTLDPPLDWLARHPDDAFKTGGKTFPYISPASEPWRAEVETLLERVMADAAGREALRGVVLACLEEGNWMLGSPYDESQANVKGFRRWLTARFLTDTALEEAWGDPDVTLTAAPIPIPDPDDADVDVDDTPPLVLPAAQRDYFQYVAETRADVIAAFAKKLKALDPHRTVLARYGFTLSASGAGAGHFGLARLLGGSLDGFVLPMAAIDRGLGGTGAYAGPIHSMLAHGKKCILLDGTLTGLAKNAETGALERMRGLNFESVANVQRRNFAAALVNGLGIAWADPQGDGRLHDAELWEQFAAMRASYLTWYRAAHEHQTTLDAAHSVAFPPGGPAVAVIVDERCRYREAGSVQETLLRSVVDAVLRAGAQIQLWLLEDLLAGECDDVPVYVFPNPFCLSGADRDRIHEHLRASGAAAIWMYAPGSGSEAEDGAADAGALVGMRLKTIEPAIPSGSEYTLDSYWIQSGGLFGADSLPAPRFFVDDTNADILAQYVANGKASVAMATTDGEWPSVFVGEPVLAPALLREILQLLEVPLVVRDRTAAGMDVLYLGPHLLAVHAPQAGPREFQFGMNYDIQDLFSPQLGWPDKPGLKLDLPQYETRLFLLTPPRDAATAQDTSLDAIMP
jgi:hypothetical protein